MVLSSVLPATYFPWRRSEPDPTDKIKAINTWLEDYSAKHDDCTYLDYYSAMVGDDSGLKKELAQDAVHPNKAGYAVMEPLAEKAIAAALKSK